jgi:hypothetical protein
VKATWSLWSKPYRLGGGGSSWRSELYHLYAWALSVLTVKQFHGTRTLVTDTAGASVLVESLGLPFTHVSTDFDQLAFADPFWWVLGKLYAYRRAAAGGPFFHIDGDAFLWSPLPRGIREAPIFAQNLDCFSYLTEALESLRPGWLPPTWRGATDEVWRAGANTGIVGGHDASFFHEYASAAIELIEHPNNRPAWSQIPNDWRFSSNALVEQFLFCAMAKARRVEVLYLLPSEATAAEKTYRHGFTHLMYGKRETEATDWLEGTINKLFPTYAARCRETFDKGIVIGGPR